MKALKMFAKYLKRKLAYEAILKDIQEPALRELRKCDDGQAVVDDVEFHMTKKTEKKFNAAVDEELKDLRKKVDDIKLKAENEGSVIITEKETFDSSIPKSVKDDVLSQVPDFKKHFGL